MSKCLEQFRIRCVSQFGGQMKIYGLTKSGEKHCINQNSDEIFVLFFKYQDRTTS